MARVRYIVELLPVIFGGIRNNWYQSYNTTIIEIGAQKSQSGPIALPNICTGMYASSPVHAKYCRTGPTYGTYSRNFRVFSLL